jgi:S1-C subfamily serine protease
VEAAPLTVRSVLDGSGAAQAGLRPGDVIVSAGPEQKPDLSALRRLLQGTVPGDEFPLAIRRGRREIELRVQLISFGEHFVLRERERARDAAP